jgi:D-xylose 1-dehydrogenase (NADP+, D-xylono-1,5-lactone-forming)
VEQTLAWIVFGAPLGCRVWGMNEKFGWGIMGPGRIARAFATGLKVCETGELVGVGSRDLGRAEAFCEEFGGRGFGSYEELLADEAVQGVYIATPHHLHVEQTIACAEAGKHVLVEKPCALDEAGARLAIDACRSNGVMFAEAFMYRMHPMFVALKNALQNGEIGEVRHVQSEFGFNASREWTDPRSVLEWGGGALMDLGCYCVSLARLAFDAEPVRCTYLFGDEAKGYDGIASGSMLFPNGGSSSFGTAVHCSMKNEAVIYGSEGRIEIDNPWYYGTAFRVVKYEGDVVELREFENVDKYANEADVFVRSIELGGVEMMTPEDSLGNMRAMDALRRDGGLDFGTEWTTGGV